MMKSSALIDRGHLPPMSTWHHSCDECSKAFPIFAATPRLCIVSPKNKKQGMPGNEATVMVQ